MSRRRTSSINIRNFIGTTSLRTSRPLSSTSMLRRAGGGGSQASTATYFVPNVSYAIRGHSSDAADVCYRHKADLRSRLLFVRFRGQADVVRPAERIDWTRLTPMYGPAVRCKRIRRVGGCAVMHQCIRPLIEALCAPGHHGYQRACDLITGKASRGHLGHQCSHTPRRPILHLLSHPLSHL